MINPVTEFGPDKTDDLPDIIKAAYRGDSPLVRQLIQQGVDVNTVDPRDNLTVLHIACLQNDRALADVVLDRDREHGDVDFFIKSAFRPRLAWQYAANGDFRELAARVHDATLARLPKPKPFSIV